MTNRSQEATRAARMMGGISRRSAARIVAALGALFWGFFFFGLIDLMVPVLKTPGFHEYYLLETGWGVLYFGLVGVPLAFVAGGVSLRSPVVQVAVAGMAVAVAAIAAAAWLQLLAAAGLLCTAAMIDVLATEPSHRQAARRLRPTAPSSRRGWLMLLFAVASLAPAVTLAWDLVSGAREGRAPRDDITFGLDHWPMQAGLALALPMMALLASQQLRGWRVTANTTAAGAAWLGGFSVAYPAHAGSLGQAGGWLALGLATLFVLASMLPEQRVENRPRA